LDVVGNVNVGVAEDAGVAIVNFPDAVDEASAIVPFDVPGMPSTGAVVYAGAAEEVVLFPSKVPPPAFANAAVNVPDVVTAPEGVEERTVPSPVNVTDVTVPVPAGRSVDAIVLKVGVAAEPDVGPARNVFCVCVSREGVSVPAAEAV
jgi:hypothetical protein